jgi:tetratricopeptide (TPR) repeat protein
MDDYYNLGVYSRADVSENSTAQLWFDRGLNWVYGYNHNEAMVCFGHAIAADPDCAMAHWGMAYAVGPNYNLQWSDFTDDEKVECLRVVSNSLTAAQKTATGAGAALIAALVKRFPDTAGIEDFTRFNDIYAHEMRKVFAQYPDDMDIRTLAVEAMMNRNPWQLWDLKTGKPTDGSDTLEAQTLLEYAFANQPGAWQHPGLLHMYIHLMEMSPHPEKALRMGDALVGLVPDAGHLEHMATHIDVLCGHYENVVRRNQRAFVADQKFLARAGTQSYYTTYICHDIHFQLYGAMFLGQIGPALDAAQKLETILTPEVIAPSADWLESYYGMRQHVLIRFGQWDTLKACKPPEDQELFSFTTALVHYSKTVAYAATGEVDKAEAERILFRKAQAAVPESRLLFNNTCQSILEIAAEMLEGELAYRKGEYDTAFAHLRRSVALDDALPYEEPWGWMQPTRHALGALLLEQGHVAEAEAVYRADLGFDASLSRAAQHPENVWSLHGLYECLERLGKTAEALMVKPLLDLANARADAPIKASCACRLLHMNG